MGQVYINANILTGILCEDGTMQMTRGHVFTKGGMILKVMTDAENRTADDEIFSDYEVTDLKEQYLLPGLINMHVHLPLSGNPIKVPKISIDYKFLFKFLTPIRPVERYFAKKARQNARTALLSGTTTIRAVGGVLTHDSEARDKINEGKTAGARILCANAAISVPGGHFAGSIALEAESPDHAKALVRSISESNPDFIKLMVTGGVMDADEDGVPGKLLMPPEIIRAACDEAHARGYRVAAHAESTEGIRAALQNGVDIIEHGAELDEESIRLLKENHGAVVCTILPFIVCAEVDPALGYCPETNVKNGKKVLEGIVRCARQCLENGIPVGLGTDAGCPFSPQYDMWREVDLFTRYVGVSGDFALHTATLKNAELMGIDHLTGSIVPGKSADFMVVGRNPLQDLSALRAPVLVSMGETVITAPKIKKHPVSEREFDRLLEKTCAPAPQLTSPEHREEPVLRAVDLCKTYGKGDGTTVALDRVNMEIFPGELVVILGSSGSGKSTLLNLLGGVDSASSGQVLYCGKNISAYGDVQLTKYRKDHVGFVFQSFNLIQTLTARENVAMALDTEDRARIDRVLDLVSLSDKKDSYPAQMSGGQQQRVSIARALVKDASLLLCDEPTGALDYENGKNIIEILEELARVHHKTVVIVTHTREIGDMADRVIHMKNSKITAITVNPEPVPAANIEW